MIKPLCKQCRLVPRESLGRYKSGKQRLKQRCWRCHNSRRKNPKHAYKLVRKGFCETCGFIPEHVCQLDVDHIDGNHKNNLPENLQTLCANCHRLKTFKQRYT